MWEETGVRDNSVPCFGRCPHVVVANISPHFCPSLSCYQSLQQQKFSFDVSDNTTDGKMSCNTSFSWNIKPNFLWSIQKRINPPGWTIRMMKTPRAKIEMKTNHMIYCIQIKTFQFSSSLLISSERNKEPQGVLYCNIKIGIQFCI